MWRTARVIGRPFALVAAVAAVGVLDPSAGLVAGAVGLVVLGGERT